MKKILVALSAICLVAACGGPKPEDSVKGFFDAMKAGDGEKAVSYLSQSTIDEMSNGLEQLKADTTGFAIGMISSMLDTQLTQDQVNAMDGRQFAAMLLGSSMIQQQIGTIEYAIGTVTIKGDSATVSVTTTVNGQSSTNDATLLREGGAWKLEMPEFGM